MDFDIIVIQVKKWQKEAGLWQDDNGKIDKEKVNKYQITNCPTQKIEFIICNSTPANLSSKGQMPLWHYVNQCTLINLGFIDVNKPNEPLVITRIQSQK